ncbi:MAG: nicotinamide-nucleotide adenylyltransferase, partial [Candidatus Wolframiiraptor sp.]
LAVSEEGINLFKILLIPGPEVGEHSIWVSNVKSFCPRFDVVYTNNPLVRRLFEDEGYPVKQLELYRRDFEMGTRIRRMMLEGEPWEDLVPKSVAEFIKKIKGVERLKEICSRD